MKVLWLCNSMPSIIAKIANQKEDFGGGWVSGLINQFSNKNVEICVVCPGIKEVSAKQDNISCYVYNRNTYPLNDHSEEQTTFFLKTIDEFKPDIIELFGSEYPSSRLMMDAAERRGLGDRVVLHIQGMPTYYERHFYGNLPFNTIYGCTIRNLLRFDPVFLSRKEMKKRGIDEQILISKLKHVIGRTEWDKACSKIINPQIEYYQCNESLRESFYSGHWTYEACQRHSIFVSQTRGIVKSFYSLVRVFPQIKEKFPDAVIYTTGNILNNSLSNRIKETYYHRYIRKLIVKNNLEKSIVFLGNLNEEEMKKQYLKANVFVSCSSIENSPNSLGEAMLLGVPCISSDVGGVKNMLCHGSEGFIYPYNEEYMLQWYIIQLFENSDLCKAFSENARKHAKITHNTKKNADDLWGIYKEIYGESSDE